jgi:ABC-type transporter Mla subunit MlaD
MRVPTVADVVRFGVGQVEELAKLPDSITLLNRSLANFAATVSRLDTLVQRLDRLTEPLEEPLTALAPRLNALVPLLDEDVLAQLPLVLDSVRRNAVPALEVIGQTQAQVASIASSVERLMQVMDDTLTRLQELPGMGLVNRLRSGTGSDRAVAPPPAPSPAARPEERRGWGG